MITNFCSLVTRQGLEKQIQCINNTSRFVISHIAVGDGNGALYEVTEDMTELKNETWRGEILSHGMENGKLFATVLIPINVGGFTIREIGLFDTNNVLLCVASCPEINKHDSTVGGAQELFIKMYMTLANSDIAPLIEQSTLQMATVEYVSRTYATRGLDNLSPEGEARFNQKQNNLTAGEGIEIENDIITNLGALIEPLGRVDYGIPIISLMDYLYEELGEVTVDFTVSTTIYGTVYEVITN